MVSWKQQPQTLKTMPRFFQGWSFHHGNESKSIWEKSCAIQVNEKILSKGILCVNMIIQNMFSSLKLATTTNKNLFTCELLQLK